MTDHSLFIAGSVGEPLTGQECRILRASLGLERRHVAVLADIVLGMGDITTERVTGWERSRGRGYPAEVVTLLQTLAAAVERGARLILEDRAGDGGDDRPVILTPLEKGWAWQAVAKGYDISPDMIERIDSGSGDLWPRLADAALVLASYRVRETGGAVRLG